jgi:hypothetical protein
MTEEQTSVTGTVDETTQDYIDTIKNLKENSVDRSKYEALRADNKRLLDSIVNGQSVESQAPVNKPSIDELRKQVFKEDQSNLDYVTHALELRDALIANGEPDPFLPYGKKIVPTDEDVAAAERVATVLKECVDYAEGDSQIFTNELQRRTVDTGPRRK